MRPVLVSSAVVITLATAGLARMASDTLVSVSDIAGNEMSSTASARTMICPMSSVGKNPLGIRMNMAAVATKLPMAIQRTTTRWCSAQSSARS